MALSALLAQLSVVLHDAGGARYGAPVNGGSSIGAHVRHVLDHVSCVAERGRSGLIDYDDRQRGTAIETDLPAAIERIRELRAALDQIGEESLEVPIRIRSRVTTDGEPVVCGTTLRRELVFVVSHTVHHHALIAMLCARLAAPVPADFGLAPATLAHLKEQTCAPSAS